MARSAKPPLKTAATPARAKSRGVAATPVPSPSAKIRAKQAVPAQGSPKSASGRGRVAAAAMPAAALARIPPPSKGELRAQIEKLEAANAALKAKSREVSRTAKVATRRIVELEEHVARLEAAAAKTAPATAVRRGRPPGRKMAVEPADALPPDVAVDETVPLDKEAAAVQDAPGGEPLRPVKNCCRQTFTATLDRQSSLV